MRMAYYMSSQMTERNYTVANCRDVSIAPAFNDVSSIVMRWLKDYGRAVALTSDHARFSIMVNGYHRRHFFHRLGLQFPM